MIELRFGPGDLTRIRFAYSPLIEMAETLYILSMRQVEPVHRRWRTIAGRAARSADLELLSGLAPTRYRIPEFWLLGAEDPSTTIEQQLERLAGCDPAWLREDVEDGVEGRQMPAAVSRVLDDGSAGVLRTVDALWEFWQAVISPHWTRMRGILDADLAYRATQLITGGTQALLTELHQQVRMDGLSLRIDKPVDHRPKLDGQGMVLVPSVFTWPNLIVNVKPVGPPALFYGARGIGRLWDDADLDPDDALAGLLGRTRAEILMRLDLPLSTTRLAARLGHSAPSVSQHLGVLKRCGLVTSRRDGRSVLYHRTALATSLLVASQVRDEVGQLWLQG